MKRTFTEFKADNLSKLAAALTYYGVLAIFPAIIALVSILGLVGHSATQPLIENLGKVAPGPPRLVHPSHLAYVGYLMHTCLMRAPVTVSTFRKEMSSRLDSVLHDHLPLPVQRGRGELALLVGAPEVKVLLGNHHFNPEVSAGEDGGFSIWLAELEIYGQGPDCDSAKQDLLDEVREYVGEYLSDSAYVRAPNRGAHLPYVLRAYIADREGDLAEVIFPAPDSQPILEDEPQLAA